MRKITLWLFSTVAALVLLFSYRTSTNSTAANPTAATLPASGPSSTSTKSSGSSPTPSASSSGSGSGSSKSSSSKSSSSAPKASASPSPANVTKAYTGSTASTRWGDVQVSITVTNGKITDVQVPVYPSGNGRDQEINAYALPILTQETLQAQNAHIDTVSGATVTSNGYLQSLQSALDAAHLS